jgi:DNA-binding LacI/PurR family transcriptional regulator/serine phosphatase RsbU (regulator of sigma subunit)
VSPEIAVKRWTIGIMADALFDSYENTVFRGIGDAFRADGATVIIFNGGILGSSDPTDAARNALFHLISPEIIDGLVVLAPVGDCLGVEALSAYCWRYARIPTCSLAIDLHGRPSVLVDNAGGMSLVLEHLIVAHRKRRIAFIRGPSASSEAERRFQVYRQLLEQHGIAFDPALVVAGDFRRESGAQAAAELCARRVKFDALVAANDCMALTALDVLLSRGFDVPGEVAVTGFDDIEDGQFSAPALTTVRQPIYESALRAGQLLATMLRGEKNPPSVTLGTQLVVRESCGCTDRAPGDDEPFRLVQAVSLAAHLTATRAGISAELRQAMATAPAGAPQDWAEALLQAFIDDLVDPSEARFASYLRVMFGRIVAVGGSVQTWHRAIAVLRNHAMRVAGDPDGAGRAREGLARATVLVQDVREQVQALRRIQREHWIRRFNETSASLTRVFGSDAFVEAVGHELVRWGIPACAISLYDPTARHPLTRAKPLFLYDQGAAVSIAGHPPFASTDLAPRGWLQARPRIVVAQPLTFRQEQLGFALFEKGPQEGEVYEGFRKLISSAITGARLVEQVVDAATRRHHAERERLEKEMEIAAKIQTSLVLKSISAEGLDVAAAMIPATEVGGDYYDVVPFDGGCWLGVGDVAGHGLQTGLVMLIIQGVVAALTRDNPHASPRDVIRILNRVMHESVRRRMKQDEHATLVLLRCGAGGQVTFSGAHEDIVLYRAARSSCERVEALGPVLGAVADLRDTLTEGSFVLERQDLMVLYTDGLIEAMNREGEPFGLDRVCAVVAAAATDPVADIRDRILAEVRVWMGEQRDDISLVVVRRQH